MRFASFVVAAACSAIALTAVHAKEEAQHPHMHLRVGTKETSDDAANGEGAIAAVVAGVHVHVSATKSLSHTPHLRALYRCEALKNEKFQYEIESMCAVRAAGFDFYYQLRNGTILRNCLCESFSNGIRDVDLGDMVVDEFNVQCNTKNRKLDGDAVKKIFNHRSITCDPFGF